MANATPDAVAGRLAHGSRAAEFRSVFGEAVFERPERAFAAAAMALEVYLQSPKEFAPYSSKYDAVLRGEARLDAREARGLRWFDDPAKGNCASCHPSARTGDGAFPIFTDFGMVGLGVPRNRALAVDRDPAFVDLGPVRPAAHRPRIARGVLRPCSARRACATSRHGAASSTTASSTVFATPSRSTHGATCSPNASTRVPPTARCRSSTTCPPATAPTSTSSRRSAATPAMRRR